MYGHGSELGQEEVGKGEVGSRRRVYGKQAGKASLAWQFLLPWAAHHDSTHLQLRQLARQAGLLALHAALVGRQGSQLLSQGCGLLPGTSQVGCTRQGQRRQDEILPGDAGWTLPFQAGCSKPVSGNPAGGRCC